MFSRSAWRLLKSSPLLYSVVFLNGGLTQWFFNINGSWPLKAKWLPHCRHELWAVQLISHWFIWRIFKGLKQKRCVFCFPFYFFIFFGGKIRDKLTGWGSPCLEPLDLYSPYEILSSSPQLKLLSSQSLLGCYYYPCLALLYVSPTCQVVLLVFLMVISELVNNSQTFWLFDNASNI